MNIYIPTSDNSLEVLEVFSYLFNKYWSPEQNVVFLGFKKPNFELPKNFSFTQLAECQIGGAENWTTYLYDFFSKVNDENFIFACDDHLITRKVDIKLIEEISKLCNNNEKIGRFDLTPSIQLSQNRIGQTKFFCNLKNYKVIELNQYSHKNFIYRITGQWSIWNREYFLKNCKPNWSPWQWEIEGGRMSEGDGYHILGTSDHWCIKKIEGLSGKQFPGILNVKYLKSEDIDYIINNNLCPSYKKKYVSGYDFGDKFDKIIFGDLEYIDGM